MDQIGLSVTGSATARFCFWCYEKNVAFHQVLHSIALNKCAYVREDAKRCVEKLEC